MKHQKMLSIVILFITFMSSIECCTTKWNNPQSRALKLETVTSEIESMTTTEDFTDRTTTFVTEIDFTTTINQDYDNVDTTTTNNMDKRTNRLPGQFIDLSQIYTINRCLGLHEEAYCMNGGKCLNYTMKNVPAAMFLSCECADGFIDERCETKYWEGSYKSHDAPLYRDINTIHHHIYKRLLLKEHYESNSSSSLYHTAHVHLVTAIAAGIVLVLSYRMLLR